MGKYTVEKWIELNRERLDEANKNIQCSGLILQESLKKINEKHEKLQSISNYDQHKKSHSNLFVNFWKDELSNAQKLIEDENQKLSNITISNVDIFLNNISIPIDTVNSCITLRNTRIQFELVHDRPDEMLTHLISILQDIYKIINNIKHNIIERIRNENVKTQYDAIIEKIEKSRQETILFEKCINEVIKNKKYEIYSQFNNLKNKFILRIDDVRKAKEIQEKTLHNVNLEIEQLEKNIECISIDIGKDIQTSECVDQSESIDQVLMNSIKSSQKNIRALNRSKLDLENDIQIKQDTIYVDENECMGLIENVISIFSN
ncbi:hypothetical protein A3Q56_06271 [Intoshia linei]|uniref:Tektin n=1 Tax=Intoshia linei TaxID=1819745 RepID=A0A177AVK5_9BILA|nr:hypothetical protein A3Q56_06271 [Intoshia linei]